MTVEIHIYWYFSNSNKIDCLQTLTKAAKGRNEDTFSVNLYESLETMHEGILESVKSVLIGPST